MLNKLPYLNYTSTNYCIFIKVKPFNIKVVDKAKHHNNIRAFNCVPIDVLAFIQRSNIICYDLFLLFFFFFTSSTVVIIIDARMTIVPTQIQGMALMIFS